MNDTSTKSLRFSKDSLKVEINQGETRSVLEYLATSDATPVSAELNALDTAGKVAAWLRVNKKLLKKLPYTTGSEISLEVNAAGLPAGNYAAKVVASSPGYEAAVLKVGITVK